MDTPQVLLITQLLIYALGWACASLTIQTYQSTSRELSFSALCFAVSLQLASQTPEILPSPFLAAALPEFFKAQAFFYASSAATGFFHREVLARPMQRWLLALLLCIPAGLTSSDPYLRHGLSSLIISAIVLITALRIYPALIGEFGQRHPVLIRSTGVVFLCLLAAKAFWQQFPDAATPNQEAELLKDIVFMFVHGILYLSGAVMLGIRLVRETQELAIRDPLTGLLNRRGLASHFAQLPAEEATHYALLLADIDHFKRVNDTHGHAVGDQILQQIAAALRKETRTSDAAARMGGEEFLLVLHGTGADQAKLIAERLCARIANTPLRSSAGNIPVTISIGLTQTLVAGEALETALERADQALYRAKAGGRNRVCLGETAPPRPRFNTTAKA